MEKKMETTIKGYIWTTIRIYSSFIPSYPKASIAYEPLSKLPKGAM